MSTDDLSPKKRGRPATGRNREKICITVPIPLAALARKKASKKEESLSQFITRAVQNLVLQP